MHIRPLTALSLAALLLTGCTHTTSSPQSEVRTPQSATPVILDTDIGNDIDDTFALAMLLHTPSLDLKLVTTTDGQPEYRARLVAKLLSAAHRSDVPIALGPDAGKPTGKERESSWLANFQLSDYPGPVHRDDGVRALLSTIHASKTPPTIIAIGPLQTLAAALDADPSIAPLCNLVAMQGSVFKGYNGSPTPAPEFNVVRSIPSAQKVLSAPWRSITLTPLDTCGLPGVSVSGPDYQRLQSSQDPLVQSALAAYASWAHKTPASLTSTTTLYDTVAIYLATPSHPLLQFQTRPLAVTDKGMTVISPTGHLTALATSWTNLPAYRTLLLETLLHASPTAPPKHH